MIRTLSQKQVDSTVDGNYEKIKEQGAKVFMGVSDPTIAEE